MNAGKFLINFYIISPDYPDLSNHLWQNKPMTNPTLDPEKQKQAKQYARIHRRVWLLDTFASTIYLLAWLLFGWAKSLAGWLRTYTANDWLLVLAFIIIFGGIASVLELPLGYYSGFVLPHRFGQSTQTFQRLGHGPVQELLVAAPLGLLVLELIYLALRLTGAWWWLGPVPACWSLP